MWTIRRGHSPPLSPPMPVLSWMGPPRSRQRFVWLFSELEELAARRNAGLSWVEVSASFDGVPTEAAQRAHSAWTAMVAAHDRFSALVAQFSDVAVLDGWRDLLDPQALTAAERYCLYALAHRRTRGRNCVREVRAAKLAMLCRTIEPPSTPPPASLPLTSSYNDKSHVEEKEKQENKRKDEVAVGEVECDQHYGGHWLVSRRASSFYAGIDRPGVNATTLLAARHLSHAQLALIDDITDEFLLQSSVRLVDGLIAELVS